MNDELDRPTDSPNDDTARASLVSRFTAAREAQGRWSRLGVERRLRVIRAIRHQIADRADRLIAAVTYPHRTGPAETLAAELIPLADACRFLEREAAGILGPRRLRRRSRPLWLRGVSVELRREPFGVVLVVGAANYPLFLTGVQTLQALAAGNAVFIKPAAGSTTATQALVDAMVAARLEEELVQVLPEEPQWVEAAIQAGAEKVVLTGSAETGRRVQSLLSQSLTPATMELSGCDAVFVLPSADLDRVARALAFGLRFNGSATCIAPRRVFVPNTLLTEFEQRLCRELSQADGSESIESCSERTLQWIDEAIRDGAHAIAGGIAWDHGSARLAGATVLTDAKPDMNLLRADVFAPVLSLVPVTSTDEALRANRKCPYALGAVVFGAESEARSLAQQIDAGCVVINDLIAPTADPRVPFGGRKQSGFGVTRGAAGLREMTQIKAIIHQRSGWLPHLDPTTPQDAQLLAGYLGMIHGRYWRTRLRCARSAIQAVFAQRTWKRQQNERRRGDV